MGLGDVTSKILLQFKADTKPARKEIRKLKGEQKKAAKSSLAATEKQNAAFDKQIGTLAKIGIAVGTAIVAFKALTAAVDFYAKRQQLIAAAAGADINRITKAARGLITEQEALQFAAAALNTEFKLSQKQMEEVAKFMVVLRNQGNDLEAVQKRLTQAIVEGNSRALKEFGVIVDGSTGKLKTQQKILVEITRQNNLAGEALELHGDQWARLAIQQKDAVDQMKAQFGELGVAAVEGLAVVGAAARDLAFNPLRQVGVDVTGGVAAIQRRAREIAGVERPLEAAAANIGRGAAALQGPALPGLGQQFSGQDIARARQAIAAEVVKLIGGTGFIPSTFQKGLGKKPGKAAPGEPFINLEDFFVGEGASRFEQTRGTAGAVGGFGGPRRRRDPLGIAVSREEFEKLFATAGQSEFARIASDMAMVGSAAEQLAGHMQAVGGEFLNAFEAAGSGQKSLTAALEGFARQGAAKVLRTEAEKHLALATAAFFTPGGQLAGVGHLAAAASLSAAAGKFGGGGGAGGAVRGGGGLPGAAAGAFGGGGGQSREVIFIGGNLDEDDPRGARRRMRDRLDRVNQEQGPGTTIVRA